MTAAVLGASGYGGQMLMRLLLDHPRVKTILPVSSSAASSPLGTRDAGLGADPLNKLNARRRFLSREEAADYRPRAVFSALPHGDSASFCEPFFDDSVIFDLSADFRLRDSAVHERTYGASVPFPRRRSAAVYGLAEFYADDIRSADIIAVPGCYPTCVLLALLPLARSGLLEGAGAITVNALSGISGAGRKPRESLLFVERSESAAAYSPGQSHRHVPEMLQELKRAGNASPFFFTPHLVPMRRGIAASITVWMGSGSSCALDYTDPVTLEDAVDAAYRESFGNSPFVRMRGEDPPDTRDVAGSNRCDIGRRAVKDTEGAGCMLCLFSVIDNLVKGAAGAAVQAFNLRFGFDESAGLPLHGKV